MGQAAKGSTEWQVTVLGPWIKDQPAPGLAAGRFMVLGQFIFPQSLSEPLDSYMTDLKVVHFKYQVF